MDIQKRANESAQFLGVDPAEAEARLAQGFHHNHHLVAEDFRAANPQNDDELLEWYRNTDAYIWELSAYHLEPGFNYSGMCEGIAQHLKVNEKEIVLCLGDGVGDLTLTLGLDDLCPLYHDLKGSQTAGFAFYMGERNGYDIDGHSLTSKNWDPSDIAYPENVEAVVALDFFEHLVNVEDWVQAVYTTLKPGGIFLAQNAFAIGDDEHGGSIPMHLTRNNRFEHDWEPLLLSLGFTNMNNGWFQKSA